LSLNHIKLKLLISPSLHLTFNEDLFSETLEIAVLKSFSHIYAFLILAFVLFLQE